MRGLFIMFILTLSSDSWAIDKFEFQAKALVAVLQADAFLGSFRIGENLDSVAYKDLGVIAQSHYFDSTTSKNVFCIRTTELAVDSSNLFDPKITLKGSPTVSCKK